MRREYPNGFVRALRWAATMSDDADELLDAADEIERLREALKTAKDLAEYWINRECTVNYSQQEYNSWLALGHQSRAMGEIRAALDKKEE